MKKESGNFIRALMKKRGITQEELGKMIGLHRQTISQILNGNRYFQTDELTKLSKIFDIKIDDIVRGGECWASNLKRYVEQNLKSIAKTKIPYYKDQYGKTLLDYVIDTNDLEKFNYFYDNNYFREPLHDNIDLLIFFIKSKVRYNLYREFKSKIDLLNGKSLIINQRIKIPNFSNNKSTNAKLTSRLNVHYYHFNNKIRELIDSLLECESRAILSTFFRSEALMSEKAYNIESEDDYPRLFPELNVFLTSAIVRNRVFPLECFAKNKKRFVLNQEAYDLAIEYQSTKVAKFIFENTDIRTVENLRKIRDTKFIGKWIKILSE